MARIRTIKPEFWTSEELAECSRDARLLFIGLWNFCDDGGRHILSEKRIAMEIFPGDGLDSTSIRRMLDELSSNDLLLLYECSHNRKSYIQVNGWLKHQKIDRPSFVHPGPDGTVPKTADDLSLQIKELRQTFVECSSNARRAFDESSPPEWNGREGNINTPLPPSSKKFVKPTLEEVASYCAERGNSVEPQAFLDHYESNGWRVGKNPMKDWRAAVRNWERTSRKPAEKKSRVATDDDLANWNPHDGGASDWNGGDC